MRALGRRGRMFMPVRGIVRRCGLILLSLVGAVALGGSLLKAEDAGAYFTGIDDLPVMPGLVELVDAGVVFDKPSGRIVEAFAAGDVSAEEVFEFYRQVLESVS